MRNSTKLVFWAAVFIKVTQHQRARASVKSLLQIVAKNCPARYRLLNNQQWSDDCPVGLGALLANARMQVNCLDQRMVVSRLDSLKTGGIPVKAGQRLRFT